MLLKQDFPISSPGDFSSVEQISKHITNATVCALSRAVEKDIEVAGQALKYAKRRGFIQGSEHQIITSKANSILIKKIF